MLNHNYIGTEHILLGLIHEGEGVAAKALESLGISLEGVRSQVEEIIGQGQQAPSGHIPFTPRAKKVLELSLREALHRFGVDPAAIPTLARRPDQVLAYLEVHIEQGPVLEAEGLPTGIVTAINGGGLVGFLLGALFIALGVGRIQLERKRGA